MHAYCELHSLLLALYRAYHALLDLETHPELHTIRRAIEANLIEALHQSGAHALLHTLKGLPAKIPRAHTFCTKCYHLGHLKTNCHYYQCVHCKMYRPNHEPENCVSKPFIPEIGKRWSRLKEETPSPPPLPTPFRQRKPTSSKNSSSSNSSGISKKSKGKKKAHTPPQRQMSRAINQAFNDLDAVWDWELWEFTADAQENDYIFDQTADNNISGEPSGY